MKMFNDIEIADFKPCIYVNDGAGVTICQFEDVAYVAKPLHPGLYHFIDELRAVDDDRLVGVQFWCGTPRAKEPANEP